MNEKNFLFPGKIRLKDEQKDSTVFNDITNYTTLKNVYFENDTNGKAKNSNAVSNGLRNFATEREMTYWGLQGN